MQEVDIIPRIWYTRFSRDHPAGLIRLAARSAVAKIHQRRNRAQQFVTELNQGNLESIRQFVATDFFAHSPAADEPNATQVYYDLLSDLKAAFPNLSLALENVRAEDDLLKGRSTLSGSHDGALWGAPASDVSVTWAVDVALRPINGQFAVKLENLATPEILGVLRQIKVVPPPEDMDKPPKYPVSLPEILLKVLFTGQVADKPCSHVADIQVTEPTVDVCQECVALGDEWPALRMCLICGYVGCCDMAKNKHMKAHYEQTGHPVFRSIHMNEGWIWCYPDNAFYSQRILDN
jgi:predicted ester cyclase